MSDGKFTVPIVTDTGLVLAWGRGECIVHGAAYHKERGTDLRFLRYANGEVVEISQEEKDAIIAQDAAALQAAADAATQAAIDAANAPFEVSKFRLCMAFQQAGKLADFMSFINADAERAFLWDAATVLDSDNPMVLAALDGVSSLLPEGCTPHDLLLQCKA
jgi:hypothetical protein